MKPPGDAVGFAAGKHGSRRRFLGAAGLGAISHFWADWLGAESTERSGKARAKSVILIFNSGAPSHIDLWDMKPDAPETVRGPFTVFTALGHDPHKITYLSPEGRPFPLSDGEVIRQLL